MAVLMNAKTIVGCLRESQTLSADNRCSSAWDFDIVGGGVLFDIDIHCDAPKNRLIRARFCGSTLTSYEWEPAPQARRSFERKDIALVRVMGPGSEPAPLHWRGIREEARELQHFLRMTNKGEWTEVSVTPYIVISGQHKGLSFDFLGPDVQAQLAEQNPDGYQHHNYWHGRGGSAPGLNGQAWVDSTKAWSWGGGIQTIRHETGHCLGMYHSGSPQNPYGDPECDMARGPCGYCGPQMVNIDQISAVKESTGTDFLVPIECHADDLRSGECQILTITVGQDRIALSTRKLWHQSLTGLQPQTMPEGTIQVHKVRGSGDHFGLPTYLGSIRVGESEEFLGRQIQNAGVEEGVVMVCVDGSEPLPFPQPADPVGGDEITDDLSGIWHNPDFAVQGFDLTVDGGSVSCFWLTHHPQGPHSIDYLRDHHGQQWYRLYGHASDGIARLDIYDHEDEKVGWGELKFSGDRALFRFYTTTLGRDHWTLERLAGPKESSSNEDHGTKVSTAKYGNTLVRYRMDTDGSWGIGVNDGAFQKPTGIYKGSEPL
jgi:hypothetical protein